MLTHPDKWKGKNWSDTDIAQALVLWTVSKKAYRYLLKNKILPLPSETLLQKKIQYIRMPPGFLDDIGPILTTKAALLSPKNRVVQLSMDEVDKFRNEEMDVYHLLLHLFLI